MSEDKVTADAIVQGFNALVGDLKHQGIPVGLALGGLLGCAFGALLQVHGPKAEEFLHSLQNMADRKRGERLS